MFRFVDGLLHNNITQYSNMLHVIKFSPHFINYIKRTKCSDLTVKCSSAALLKSIISFALQDNKIIDNQVNPYYLN